MNVQGSTPELVKNSNDKVLDQLNRILSSKAFRQADRLKRFLSFVVDETISGRSDRLKEFVVGVEVFGKDTSFDPRNDPIVRVQARRLRAQLARYYREEGQEEELVIEMPKGGYAPIFRPLKSAPPKRSISPAFVSRNTVLVLPFADHSLAGDQQYFCEGLTQEIIHTLAGMDAIRLVASTQAVDSAAMIINGSVRLAGSEVRITANLVDTAGDCYLWSDSIDRKLENIF